MHSIPSMLTYHSNNFWTSSWCFSKPFQQINNIKKKKLQKTDTTLFFLKLSWTYINIAMRQVCSEINDSRILLHGVCVQACTYLYVHKCICQCLHWQLWHSTITKSQILPLRKLHTECLKTIFLWSKLMFQSTTGPNENHLHRWWLRAVKKSERWCY